MDTHCHYPLSFGMPVVAQMVLCADLLQLFVGTAGEIKAVCQYAPLSEDTLSVTIFYASASCSPCGKTTVGRFSVKHSSGWDRYHAGARRLRKYAVSGLQRR